MDRSPYHPLLILIALAVATSLALVYGVNVRTVNELGIRSELPETVGPWHGVSLYYCQNPKCEKFFSADQLTNTTVCPACGSALDTASAVERGILPADTIILKSHYTNPSGGSVYVAVVMSGSDRSSIHRPQLCLVGQGNEILKSRVIKVPLADGRDSKVMVLDLSRRLSDGRMFESYYAYWFACRDRETPSHVVRMIWMAWDRIVHSSSYRWSYIAVSGLRTADEAAYVDEVRSFVHYLNPALASP